MQEEPSIIDQAIGSEKDPQYLTRLRAVKALLNGEDVRKVARDAGKSMETVARWQKSFANGGLEAIRPRTGGRRPHWTTSQLIEIERRLQSYQDKTHFSLSEIRKTAEEVLGQGFFAKRPKSALSKLLLSLGLQQSYAFAAQVNASGRSSR